MSVTVTKNDGVTVLMMTSDPENIWPPLCQIIRNLCYSPKCCSVSWQLRKVQRTSLSVLGVIQIMIGLLNIGLGSILHSSSTWVTFPFWLGGLFIAFGVICILTEKYPSLCMIFLNVTLNLAGVALAITAIVLYSVYIANLNVWWDCQDNTSWYPERTTQLPSPYEVRLSENCNMGKEMFLTLLRGINSVLIVLSVLELCVVVSTVVFGIKDLRSSKKKEYKSPDEPEYCKLQPEKITIVSAA